MYGTRYLVKHSCILQCGLWLHISQKYLSPCILPFISQLYHTTQSSRFLSECGTLMCQSPSTHCSHIDDCTKKCPWFLLCDMNPGELNGNIFLELLPPAHLFAMETFFYQCRSKKYFEKLALVRTCCRNSQQYWIAADHLLRHFLTFTCFQPLHLHYNHCSTV